MRYFALLKDAIRLFYEWDAAKLLRGEDNKSACERCIVNCIARYLWCLIQQRGLKVDVDVEYNLDCKSGDFKRIQCETCRDCSCKACLMHAFATGELSCDEQGKKLDTPFVYPDLVVHARGPGKNYLAVEFKKEYAARYGKGAYTDAAMWDMAKLQYFACKQRKDGIGCYDKVVYVILRDDKPEYIRLHEFPSRVEREAEGVGKCECEDSRLIDLV